MRKFFAVALFLSVIAFTSVSYAFASDHSPGVQHELVLQMTSHFDKTQMIEVSRPATAAVVYDCPASESEGIVRTVEAHCNSPGI